MAARRTSPPPAPRNFAPTWDSPPDPEVVAKEKAREDDILAEATSELTGEAVEVAKARLAGDEAGIKVDAPVAIDLDDMVEAQIAEYAKKYPFMDKGDILDALGFAKAEVMAEKKDRAKKAIIKAERARLKYEEGLVTGVNVLDEMVEIDLKDLQPWQDPISINFVGYYRGQVVSVPRHIANQILEMIDRGRRAERDRTGESWLDYYRRPHETVISPVGVIAGNVDQRVH